MPRVLYGALTHDSPILQLKSDVQANAKFDVEKIANPAIMMKSFKMVLMKFSLSNLQCTYVAF